MSRVILEFEFVSGEAGGKYVAATQDLARSLVIQIARGELEAACRLYEDAGTGELADELIATVAIDSSHTQRNLARMFAMARDFPRAAKVLEHIRVFAEAAQQYEQGGDFVSAGRCHEQASEPLKAAAAYERGKRPDLALKLYLAGGAHDAAAGCLARMGRPYDAARVYEKLGNPQREVELLAAVPPTDVSYPAAVKRLARMYEKYGRRDDAANVLVTALRSSAAAAADWDVYRMLVALFETLGNAVHAQRVREVMRERGGPSDETPADPAGPATPPGGGGAVGGEARVDLDEKRWSAEAYAFLKATPIFADLSLDDMKELYRTTERRTFAPGETLIDAGGDGPGLFVVVGGEVAIYDPSGARLLNTVGPGAHLGEISLVQRAPASATAIANGSVRALYVSRERFAEFVYTHEAAALRIYRVFCLNLAARVRALSGS